MVGKRAPELVAGKLASVADQAWAAQDTELHCMPLYTGAAPLTEAEGKHTLGGAWLDTSLVVALLRLKTTHWQQLPWLL